jgi:hypothetical protein
MKLSPTPMLLASLILWAGLHADQAVARTHAAPSASRYTHWLAERERYPLGSPDFYHQFAEPRERMPATVVAGLSGGLADSLGGASQVRMAVQDGAAWNGSPGTTATEDAIGRRSGEATEGRHEAPASGLALPIAALGLMLFVARRRASLQ